MSETLKPPRRAYMLDLKVDADSLDDLIGYLRTFETDLYMGKVSKGISGGYSSGAIYDLSVDETITHESWVVALEAYINEIDKDTENSA
jgi:hypothetical protein